MASLWHERSKMEPISGPSSIYFPPELCWGGSGHSEPDPAQARRSERSRVPIGPLCWIGQRKIGVKPFIDWQAIIRFWHTAGRVMECVVGRGQPCRIVSHQVRHDRSNPLLLVIKHDRRAAICARAQLKRTVRILVVERLAIETFEIFNG